jgi:hypothetical protein
VDLYDVQMQDDDHQMLQTFMTKNEWPPKLTKARPDLFQDVSGESIPRQE